MSTLRLWEDARRFADNIEIQMHFLEWKCLKCKWNFTEVCSYGSTCESVSTGSGNGLAPHRGQAITWTNGDCILQHHMALLGWVISSDYRLAPRWHQAIIWTNVGIEVPTLIQEWNSSTFYGLFMDKITFFKHYGIIICHTVNVSFCEGITCHIPNYNIHSL